MQFVPILSGIGETEIALGVALLGGIAVTGIVIMLVLFKPIRKPPRGTQADFPPERK